MAAPRRKVDEDDIPDDRKASGGLLPANGGETVGDYVTLPPEDEQPEFIDVPGGQLVTIGPATERPQAEEEGDGFYSNLASTIPDDVLQRVAADLLRKIDVDKETRKKRDEMYEEGIRRTGLGKDAPGGAQFEGASRVVHPMLTEACIDYESRVIKEIFPPSGPVKPKIVGVVTEEKSERADRKTEHMNWQITSQIKEARAVLETTFTQVPLGGSAFIKQTWDHRLGRPQWQFIPVDMTYLPFNAASWASAKRRTFEETLSAVEFQQRIESGQYRKLDNLPAPSMQPEKGKAAEARAKVEGKEDQGLNIDGDRKIFETMAYLEVTEEMAEFLEHEEAGKLYPYLVSIDETSKKVLSFYRDWEENDPTRDPIEHLFEFPFIPWDGPYSVGFPQIIGGLSGAATGALRALMDSAMIQNSAGGLVLKGSGASGTTKRPNPAELTEIDVGLEADDIRKRVLPNSALAQPSPVLFQLMGFLVDAAKGTVRTSLDETAIDTNANTPVGTQLSRVEEGMVVFSAIHGRVHNAMNALLRGLHRLNRLYLPELLRVDAEGKEILVKRSDYEGPCDIQPVSDPTIYSDMQRQGQIVGLEQLSVMFPNKLDADKILEAHLKLLKLPNYKEFIVQKPAPTELNAVQESLALSLGKPVVAFPEQNHLAHLQVHLDFTDSPMLGGNPLIAPVYLPGVLRHIAEHIVYFYTEHTMNTVQKASGMKAVDLMSQDDRVKKAFDALLAQASQVVVPAVNQTFQGAMPVIQKAMALLQQYAPKPPLDPAVAAATQASMAETQRKAAADQTGAQTDQQKNALLAERNQIDQSNAALAAQTKIQSTEMDNSTAIEIASERLQSGQPAHFINGESMTQQ